MRGANIVKILLVQCPCSYGTETPPLGLAYLSSYMKKHNHDVSVLDLSMDLYMRVDEKDKAFWQSNNGYRWYLKDMYDAMPFLGDTCYEQVTEKILSLNSDIVGFSIQNTSTLFTLEIIKRIKSRAPSKKIVLGGPNCYNVTGNDLDFKIQHDLQEFADIIVVGEGESVLLDFAGRIESGRPLDTCKGIAMRKNGTWIFNGFAEPIMNLDDLPFPDFEAYDMKAYTDRNALPLLTSRGCTMRCVFCTDTYFWRPYRHRSAGNVLEEIVKRRKKYKNNFFGFNDSLINGSHKNLLEMCKLIASKRLDISWGGNCRIDKRLDLDCLGRMKKAGCEYLVIGIESASNRILRLMRKNFTIEDASDFIHRCNKVGIGIVANWIVGFPGETEEEFINTADFIIKHEGLIRKNTFSTLTINQFSYLDRHKEEFGIVLDGAHLGLWRSRDGLNTIELRNSRLDYLTNIEQRIEKDYNIVKQSAR